MTGNWLKGVKAAGDTIVVDLPQPILVQTYDGTDYYYYVARIEYDEEAGEMTYDGSNQQLKFVYEDETVTQVDGGVLALVDDSLQWMGYADSKFVMTVQHDVPLNYDPQGKAEAYTVSWYNPDYDSYEKKDVKVAFEDDKVYISGLYKTQPGMWVQGTIKDDKIVVPSRQYFGAHRYLDSDDGYSREAHMYINTASTVVEYDDWGFAEITCDLLDSLELTYDPETKSFACPENTALLQNIGKNLPQAMLSYINASFEKMELKPVKPFQPGAVATFDQYDPALGLGVLTFSVQPMDTAQNPIDAERLYYNIYFNDSLYTFKQDEYIMLPQDMTDFPVLFTDHRNFLVNEYYGTLLEETIYFYKQDIWKWGVQLYYVVDGVTTYSDMFEWQVDDAPSGIDENVADSTATVIAINYYDLMGRKVELPSQGLYIKQVVYNNGTTKTTKVMMK